MELTALVWILLPLFIAAGSALLSYYIMQARLEVAVAKERESLAEAQAVIRNQEKLMEEKVRAAEEVAARQAFDQLLADFRVEERHFMRENRSMFVNRKSLVMQERLYFRNIPLSNWIEHEMVVEEGTDVKSLAEQASVFNARSLAAAGAANGDGASRGVRLLRSRDSARTA
ncbi:MAG: hypothetical protein KatS3mg004_1275 [Bryobacteraceae bacterium]|nr:MAG: hypothetical protein KatS3mg004_1275 [Bryobacteraceae bacterium]